jgi:hypothetical protein
LAPPSRGRRSGSPVRQAHDERERYIEAPDVVSAEAPDRLPDPSQRAGVGLDDHRWAGLPIVTRGRDDDHITTLHRCRGTLATSNSDTDSIQFRASVSSALLRRATWAATRRRLRINFIRSAAARMLFLVLAVRRDSSDRNALRI